MKFKEIKLSSIGRKTVKEDKTSKRGKFGGQDPVSDSKSEKLNTVHIVSSASIFHGYGIPDFGKS